MERLHPSDLAWSALVAGIALYDIKCPPHETMSEAFDRYRTTRVGRVATAGAVIFIGGHLLRAWGEHDPLSRALSFKDRVGESIDNAMDVFGDD
jgi:hypothetical protein